MTKESGEELSTIVGGGLGDEFGELRRELCLGVDEHVVARVPHQCLQLRPVIASSVILKRFDIDTTERKLWI